MGETDGMTRGQLHATGRKLSKFNKAVSVCFPDALLHILTHFG